MNSMTGYGGATRKTKAVELEIHVKSVNGRFLDVRFHLPKELAPFENDLRKPFEAWSRGTVDVYVHRRPSLELRAKTVTLNVEQAEHWAKQLSSLSRKLKISGPSLRDIMQMPHVMESADRAQLSPGELKLVHACLAEAIERCQKARITEGQMLRKELLGLLKVLEQKAHQMQGWREEALASAHQRLKTRLAGLEGESMDSARMAFETALLIDKMDIHEELVRLGEHIKACRSLVTAEGEAKGKKMDFYSQELLREVNTIGSKSQLASLTQVVVDAKSIIEKIREQVQNVE